MNICVSLRHNGISTWNGIEQKHCRVCRFPRSCQRDCFGRFNRVSTLGNSKNLRSHHVSYTAIIWANSRALHATRKLPAIVNLTLCSFEKPIRALPCHPPKHFWRDNVIARHRFSASIILTLRGDCSTSVFSTNNVISSTSFRLWLHIITLLYSFVKLYTVIKSLRRRESMSGMSMVPQDETLPN